MVQQTVGPGTWLQERTPLHARARVSLSLQPGIMAQWMCFPAEPGETGASRVWLERLGGASIWPRLSAERLGGGRASLGSLLPSRRSRVRPGGPRRPWQVGRLSRGRWPEHLCAGSHPVSSAETGSRLRLLGLGAFCYREHGKPSSARSLWCRFSPRCLGAGVCMSLSFHYLRNVEELCASGGASPSFGSCFLTLSSLLWLLSSF